MQRERHRRHAPADAPPLRAKEIDRAAQRMAHVDVGSGDRPPVLEQEGEIRSERGQQRTDQPHADGQRDAGHRGTVFRAFTGRKSATAEVGAVLRNSRYAVLRSSVVRRFATFFNAALTGVQLMQAANRQRSSVRLPGELSDAVRAGWRPPRAVRACEGHRARHFHPVWPELLAVAPCFGQPVGLAQHTRGGRRVPSPNPGSARTASGGRCAAAMRSRPSPSQGAGGWPGPAATAGALRLGARRYADLQASLPGVGPASFPSRFATWNRSVYSSGAPCRPAWLRRCTS